MSLYPTILETVPKSYNKWLTIYIATFAHSKSCTRSLAFSNTDIWYRLELIITTLLAKLAGLGPALTGIKDATIYNGKDKHE
jgi:hypothetical protein